MPFAIAPDREDQKAAIHRRTFSQLLRSSMIAKIKKRPSIAALSRSFCDRP